MYKQEWQLTKTFNEIFDEYGMPKIPLYFSNRLKNVLGRARRTHDGKPLDVTLSRTMMRNFKDDEVIDVLKHEIAHIIDYHMRGYSNHDDEFRGIARDLGVSKNHLGPKATGGTKIEKKYHVVCTKCGGLVCTRSRKTKALIDGYRSKCCKTTLTYKLNPKYKG